jgi:hypothetical protein
MGIRATLNDAPTEPSHQTPGYEAFVPRAPGPGVDSTERSKAEDVLASSRIRCPHCDWRPNPSSRWCCVECPEPEGFFHGCGTQWNTFQTRGRCPGCQHQWRWTLCPACAGWSPHDDWYVEAPEA